GGAYAAYVFSGGTWLGLLVAIAVGMLVGAVGGVVLAAMTQPPATRGHLDQALLTLGISFIVADLLSTSFGAEIVPIAVPVARQRSVTFVGLAFPVCRLVFILVAGLLALGVYFGFESASIGMLIRATVADRDMVRAIVVDTRKVLYGVFAAGAAVAALGGVLGAPILAPGRGIAGQVLIICLVVVVCGGLGWVGHTVV